jgi:hypothetical protein
MVRARILGGTEQSLGRDHRASSTNDRVKLQADMALEELCELLRRFLDAVFSNKEEKAATPKIAGDGVDERCLVHVGSSILTRSTRRVLASIARQTGQRKPVFGRHINPTIDEACQRLPNQRPKDP